jgi:hypothetical protein
MSDSDSRRRSSPPTTPPKREGAKGSDQRAARFEARQQPPPPPPRPLSKLIDLPDEPPELRPRPARNAKAAVQTTVRQATPRVVVGARPAPPTTYNPTADAAADLERARLLDARSLSTRSYYPIDAPRRSFFEISLGNPVLILLIGVACLVIFLLASAPARTRFSNFIEQGGMSAGANDVANVTLPAPPAGEHSMLGAPSITAEDVEAVLREYNSPAAGTGRAWIALGQQYGIDPAYALAFFIHESTAGTNPGWAGLKPGGESTHNVGNIICAGYPTCYGRFRDYASWDEGIEDWYKLIAKEYVQGRSIQTVEEIVPVYAPAFENNVDAYVNAVVSMVDGWRRRGGGR